ncbi:hypothetical protein MVES1_001546 [Malassezia vespertilionis]|uniref:uncharacterized protein n=1 Tax=Malassezia vespertilionis TaxID=2020962 RepID=UPI0024B0E34C|nr:uncharacterized protein MVES1_001546 [Malassezia vespertilionis]WFD06204.1 hypothetical protein MVES1_001546 [Malassezia vespertilionis]
MAERVAAMQARHTAYLQARQDQREEDERDYIQRVAPGRGKGQPELQPTLSGPVPSEAAHAAEALPTADVTIGHKPSETHRQDTRDMEELQRLAAELRTGEEEKL